MNKQSLIAALALAAGATAAVAAPPKKPPPTPQEQKDADRAFKNGVALFKETKYAEALAEFERAYAIAPHPLVLYNMAGCHRELGHYAEAVRLYQQFLAEGAGKVKPDRIAAAQGELDDLLPRVARVTVKIEAVPGATLLVDGAPAGPLPLERPLVLAPGEYKLVARAEGRADAVQTVRVTAGQQLPVELMFAPLPDGTTGGGTTGGGTGAGPGTGPGTGPGIQVPIPAPRAAKRFALNAGFGTNVLRVGETGAPAVGVGLAIGSRLELGVDATLVAYAIIPSVRVRLAGAALSVHAIVAAPISITDDGEMETFVAGAVGVGLRLRATESLALRLESYASFAGASHGTTIPTFVGGELWF